ncbi:hypothetical protein DPMN_029037 [Dreissena polymorpha]|uniref:Uncharacterized protein n=1 Tax=Dreissena polymorpha TaxID=45954 RepID=A0A9D4LYA6_DREPO|nr:hypothetical protein DPMN_029037 [Dreissena polymorpha]
MDIQISYIIGTNLQTKFHEDRKISVASRVKNAPPLAAMMNLTKFHEDQTVNVASRTNLLTIFHEDWTVNVASRVLTRFYYSHIRKNAPPVGGHVFQANVTILELIQDIIKTNLLTLFHQDWTINMASRVLTRKNAPPPGGHVFQPIGIISELVQDNIGMNLLTKCHEDWTINLASRVLTRFYYSHYSHKRENAPPLGSHVFQAKVTIFELIQDISGPNILSKIRKKAVASRVLTRKNAPPPGGHVFQPTGIIFELFYEDQTINVASRVKNAPPLGSHVFQANITIFKLTQDIIKTNLLTKFHEDWTINVAPRELTRQMLTPHNGQKAITKAHHEPVLLR